MIERDKGLCTLLIDGVCTGRAEHVHHLHPLARGGAKYDMSNCASACAACNLHLGDSTSEPQPAPRPVSRWDE